MSKFQMCADREVVLISLFKSALKEKGKRMRSHSVTSTTDIYQRFSWYREEPPFRKLLMRKGGGQWMTRFFLHNRIRRRRVGIRLRIQPIDATD